MIPYIVIGSLVLIYVLTYVLNKKTPVPKEALEQIDEATCNSCHNFTCSHHGDE